MMTLLNVNNHAGEQLDLGPWRSNVIQKDSSCHVALDPDAIVNLIALVRTIVRQGQSVSHGGKFGVDPRHGKKPDGDYHAVDCLRLLLSATTIRVGTFASQLLESPCAEDLAVFMDCHGFQLPAMDSAAWLGMNG
jgi:hypothetical protein